MKPSAILLALPTSVLAQWQVCDGPPDVCQPVILVPGIMGSRLREHVRQPGSLVTVSRHVWLPESHRLAQRAAVFGPLSAAAYQDWVKSLDPRKPRPGHRVEPDFSNWGLKGVSCTLKVGQECVSTAKVYWDLINQLERGGFRAGNNLYGVPFDWRLLPTENKLCSDLARTLHHATNSTYRKALVVGHSLGNIQIQYCLQKVFGIETLSKIRALVAIAAPFAGAPKMARVFFSGAEMVSRMVITDAETRDFARRMGSAYLLLPDERLFRNATLMTMHGGDAQLGATTLPGYGGQSVSPINQPEVFHTTRRDLRALFDKVDAYTPGDGLTAMSAAYEESLGLVDVWQAPTVPVVCVIGSGQLTEVAYAYTEPWPRNMYEEPCIVKYEDGDCTVPIRSAEEVCQAWAEQKSCYSPLSTAHPLTYKSRSSECVDIVRLHCRAANMESADSPRGTDQCAEYHQRILSKVPTLDLVQSLAVNPRAYEPGYATSLEQLHEFTQVWTWLYNSAVRQLLDEDAIAAKLDAWMTSTSGATPPQDELGRSSPVALQSYWAVLRSQASYANVLEALQQVQDVAVQRVREAGHIALRNGVAQGDKTVEYGAERSANKASALLEEDAEGLSGNTPSQLEDAMQQSLTAVDGGVTVVAEAVHAASELLSSLKNGCSSLAADSTADRSRGAGRLSQRRSAKEAEFRPGNNHAYANDWWHSGENILSSLDLSDCSAAYEHASAAHPVNRRAGAEQTLDCEGRRAWICSLWNALADVEPALQRMRQQTEWGVLHWKRLAKTLKRPEQPLAKSSTVSNGKRAEAEYGSALYGKMDEGLR